MNQNFFAVTLLKAIAFYVEIAMDQQMSHSLQQYVSLQPDSVQQNLYQSLYIILFYCVCSASNVLRPKHNIFPIMISTDF